MRLWRAATASHLRRLTRSAGSPRRTTGLPQDRVSELLGLRWIDVVSAGNGEAFVTVFGKGGKTRTVRVSARTRDALEALRSPNAVGDDYVFAGHSVEGHIAAWTAWKIVRNAGRAAGLDREIFPHFMRHAHASMRSMLARRSP